MATAQYKEALAGVPALSADRALVQHGFDDVQLTNAGMMLFQDDPLLVDDFGTAARSILTREKPAYWEEYRLGVGTHGAVYEMPGAPGFCIKTTTSALRNKTHLGEFQVVRTLNLLTDVKIMHAIHRRLQERTAHDIHVPAHFGAVSFHDRSVEGYAMLMQRLPENLVRLDTYVAGQRFSVPEAASFVDIVSKRMRKALGFSATRIFVNDFTVTPSGTGNEGLHEANIFIDPAKSIEDTPIHAVDVVRPGFARNLARAAFALR